MNRLKKTALSVGFAIGVLLYPVCADACSATFAYFDGLYDYVLYVEWETGGGCCSPASGLAAGTGVVTNVATGSYSVHTGYVDISMVQSAAC
jgi:hypothetical protein